MKRTLSRMISVVLTLAMIISLLALPASAITWDNVSETRYASRYQTSDYATGKFYKNLTQIPLTGDGRRDVVAVAASQVGYIEGDNANGYDGETGGSTNYTEYGYFLGLTGGSGHAWCAAFCAWSFYAAEVTDTDGYYYDTGSGNIWADTYVPDWSNYLIDQGRYKAAYQFRNSYSSLYDASYVPQPGDLVFFYTASGDYPGWEGHIGLVAYSDGTYVYTLEGNTSSQDGVESEGGGMFFKKYSLTGSNLVGFGSMPYESVAGLPTIDYTGANPTPGLYVTTSGAKSVYQNINDSTASWTLPMSSVFEVTEIATASDGTVMLHSKCEINGSTVYGWIAHGSDYNGYTKTLQIYASTELEIPEQYGPSQDAQGNYSFENAYGYTFRIDDVNGTIDGEDSTLITTAAAYNSCNPNWAISVQLRPTGNTNEYSVVKVVATPGSAANAGITLASGDKILVVHSADSKPGYANWMSKVAAVALKEGDVLSISSDNKTATVLGSGEPIDPPVIEPTEPTPTEPKPTEPVDVPNYGGAIPGAGQQGYTGNLYYGVDVSFHNVNDESYRNYITNDDSGADYSLLDFKAMKASGCDYVIIRIGSQDSTGCFYDPHFITMYNLAREAGMDVGAYFYSHALTYDEAVEEAEYCIDIIEDHGMYFEYPVYIDIEEADQLALDQAGLDAIAYGWCDTMADAGYFPGIYTGYFASQTMGTQLKQDYDMWIASYGTGVTPDNDNLSDECAMWQYASTGNGGFEGIGKDDIDLNVCYKDYPAIIAAGGYNNMGQTTQPDPSEPTQPSEPETEPTQPSEPEVTEPTPTEPAIDIPNYGGAIPGAGIPGATTLAPNLYYGCDVSFYNVNDQSYANYTTSDDSGANYSLLDFNRMKADGCDFVILRMGSSDSSGYYYDPHFVTLYNMARAAGMDIGLYFYSYAMNKNEAIAEANYVIDVIEDLGMYFEYPIYIDIEESDQLALGETTLSNICYGWCDTLYAAGYYPGVYGNYNLYDAVSTNIKNDYDFWVAWVSSATSQSAYNPSTNNISNEASMWQYSFYGYEYDGVGMDMLDVNVSYKDYPAIMKAYGYNNIPQEIKIPDSYGPTVGEDGRYTFENAYGYVFNIDDVNGTIDGEDATLITNASAYNNCNPNWAISVQLRPTGNTNEYQVVKVVAMPGSAAGAGITLENGDVILVVHSAESQPGAYANWMSKVAALALKEGDIIEIASNNKTATVIGAGEIEEPTEPSEPETEPTEPSEPETEPSEPETEPSEPAAIQITQQPADFVGVVGETATFSVAAEGENLQYQWYYYDTAASEWLKAGNGTAATLNVEFKAYRNNQQYRCEITDAEGNTVVTDAVKITAQYIELEIISQPVSYTGAVNDEVTFTVEAVGNGLTYQWYYSSDDGGYWSKSGTPGFNEASVHPILRGYRDGNMYKCVITDIFGNTVTSEPASLIIEASEITITQQPASIENAVINGLYQFTVVAEGENLTYLWEVSTDGGETWVQSWSQGYESATLSVRMYDYRNGYQYRCVVTSGLKTTVVTDAAILTVQAPSAQIVGQPENVSVVSGTTATFTVEATGTDLTYVWYRSDDKGLTWTQTYLSGYNTDTLSFVANASRAAMFKCKVTDGSGYSVWSDPVKLQILSAGLQILSQPESTTCASGATAVFAVEAQGDSLKYQWYSSADGGATWTKSYLTGYNTAEFSFVVNAGRAAKVYKCVITDVAGNVVETNVVSVTIG